MATAVVIPHPNGKTARVLVPPHTPSMPSLTSDEELLMAQHAEIERLRRLLRLAKPCVDACCPTQTALLPPPNDHEIPALRREIRAALALGPNVELTGLRREELK